MVPLDEFITRHRNELLTGGLVQAICYHYVTDKRNLPKDIDPDLGDEETLAIKGYLGIKPLDEEVQIVTGRKPIKQIDYTKDIFKLLGIHLASGNLIREKVDTKFVESPLKYKYLICRVLPEYLDRFKSYLEHDSADDTPYGEILGCMFLNRMCDEAKIYASQLTIQGIDVIDLLLIEDLWQRLIAQSLSAKYQNLTAKEIVKQVLVQFGNAVKKVTRDRRKGHELFEINDEYDVQDLLYVMLKPLFPKLVVEDPVPKVGATYTKIDIGVREEGLIVEVKMIKRTDSDERKFIGQLKDDIESYYIYPYLKELLIYVYDPENKTSDVQNFHSLNGARENKGVRFNVEVVVGN